MSRSSAPPRRPYSAARHARATVLLLLVTILLGGIAYPVAIVEFGNLVTPGTAGGSLTHNPNGSVNGSRDLPPGTNVTVGHVAPAPGSPGTSPVVAPAETVSYTRAVGTVMLSIGVGATIADGPVGLLTTGPGGGP